MRALIYCRASSDPKLKLRSVGEQEQDCRTFCQANHWDIVDVIVDSNRSATKWAKRDREGWARVLAALPDVDVLVMWEASRAARRMEGFVEMRAALEKADTLLAYSGKVYDLSRGDDAFHAGLDALLAEREASSIRDRIVRSVRMRAEKGTPTGRIAFGYRRRYDPDTGDLVDQVPDEVTAPLVREMVQRLLGGESFHSIATDFQRRGIPTPGGDDMWRGRTVKRVVSTPTIAGVRVHQGEAHGPATWPGIITPEEREELLPLLDRPNFNTRGPEPRWLLGHVARCGTCGRLMESQGRSDRKVYQCRYAMCQRRAGVYADLADELVVEWVAGAFARHEIPVPGGDAVDEAAALTEQLRVLNARLQDGGRAFAEGLMSLPALRAAEALLLPQIRQLEGDLRERRGAPTVGSVLLSDDPSQAWRNLPVGAKRQVLREVFDIRIQPARRRGVFDPSRVHITLA